MSIPLKAGLPYNKVMVKDYFQKVKSWLLPKEDEIILVLAIILVTLIGFGLGRLSALHEEKFPIQIQTPATATYERKNQEAELLVPKIEQRRGESREKLYVGSKQSSVYHYPWCPGAQRIKEENKIWFSSRIEAQKAGFRPAANCEGL